jgi:ubiquinone/menaquinone biosynthesis C-methylase UbiE
MDPKKRVVATYNAAAAHFDDAGHLFWEKFSRRTVERIQLSPGANVLDVCCGTGASALHAAKAVGESGRVVAVDLAAKMLARGRLKAVQHGLSNIEFRQADVEHLDFEDGSFDAAICVFGVFFLPDVVQGIERLCRLVRAGGVLAITTWGPNLFEPANTTFWNSIRDHRPDLYKSFNPWDDIDSPEKLLDLFACAGLPRAECQAAAGKQPIRRPEDFWKIVMASGYRGTIDQLSPRAAGSVRDRCVSFLRDEGISALATNVVYGVARTPE